MLGLDLSVVRASSAFRPRPSSRRRPSRCGCTGGFGGSSWARRRRSLLHRRLHYAVPYEFLKKRQWVVRARATHGYTTSLAEMVTGMSCLLC